MFHDVFKLFPGILYLAFLQLFSFLCNFLLQLLLRIAQNVKCDLKNTL